MVSLVAEAPIASIKRLNPSFLLAECLQEGVARKQLIFSIRSQLMESDCAPSVLGVTKSYT
jgi:hypothetical protein